MKKNEEFKKNQRKNKCLSFYRKLQQICKTKKLSITLKDSQKRAPPKSQNALHLIALPIV